MAVGGIIRESKKVTSDYTIVEQDEIIYVDTFGGDITLTLAKPTNDNVVYIKKVSSANTVTIITEDNKTIDGSSSKTLTNNYSFLKLAYFIDGSNNEFKVIGESSNFKEYNSYTVLLTQSSTSAPTVDFVLENSLDLSVSITRFAQGTYIIEALSSAPFKPLVTAVFNGNNSTNGDIINARRVSNDKIGVLTRRLSTSAPEFELTDGILVATPIEIRVYN